MYQILNFGGTKMDDKELEAGSNKIIDGGELTNNSEKKNSVTREVMDWLLHIIGAIVIALLIVKFVAQVTVVKGQSMEPTLHNYNRLMMEKISPRFGKLERGDIVVLEAAEELVAHGGSADRSPLIKRVMGVEGDKIKISNGKVSINDIEISEPYIMGDYTYSSGDMVVQVPKGHIFVMGDNRPNGGSIDSRILGTFPKERVIGRVIFRIFPFNQFGGLN
jgi:signal peptidase I